MKLDNKLFEEINSIGDFEEKEKGVASVAYADAAKRTLEKERDVNERLDKHKKEILKGTEDMDSTDNSRFKHKVIKTPEMKKMHLSESLFEEYNLIDEYLNDVKMGEGWVALEKIEFDIEQADPYLEGADVNDVIKRALNSGRWTVKVLPNSGPALVQEGREVIEESLNEDTLLDKRTLLRDFFEDTINNALDNIFVVAQSKVKDLPGPADEPKGEIINSLISQLAEKLADEYFGVKEESLEEASKKGRQRVITTAVDKATDANRKLTEDLAQDELKDNSVATILNDLIIDEFEAINGYNSAITTIKDVNPDCPIINVLEDIINEENVHVGQLQEALVMVSEPAEDIKKGNKEGAGQLDETTAEFDEQEKIKEEEPEVKSSFEDEHIG